MYAEVGRSALDPEHMPGQEIVQRLQQLHAAQPGYRGYLAVEAGGGRRVYVHLWDSAEAAVAARRSEAIRAFLVEHVRPHIRGMELLGEGAVLHADFGTV